MCEYEQKREGHPLNERVTLSLLLVQLLFLFRRLASFMPSITPMLMTTPTAPPSRKLKPTVSATRPAMSPIATTVLAAQAIRKARDFLSLIPFLFLDKIPPCIVVR